ncbi:AAA family ATPase [Botrimarina sp.]|uniref:ExeA family protein n=1 Tax=Botrimarina sp. TaxID=2795802 RepID=UPI0032EBCDC6
MPSPILASGERIFPTHPRVDRYFASAAAEAARRRLVQCLVRGDGPALLIGAPGVGKSMLIEALCSELGASLRVVRLAGAQLCTRRALLQAILHGLGRPYQQREEGELRLSLSDALLSTDGESRAVALLVDEAQSLPVRLLEELRLLTNVAQNGLPRLRLVLAGSHALDEAFTAPELEAFNQRLVARCYLEPLTRDETAAYLRAHLAAAGGDPDQLLADDAYQAMWQATDGLPRLINQVGERAMVLSVEQGRPRLDAASIGAAWSDLHQLAAPWQSPASTRFAAAATPEAHGSHDDSSVEFGLLDDEDDLGDVLQAEAEAVSAAAAAARGFAPSATSGVWDADKRLHRATGQRSADPSDEAPADDEECVSYAFPSLAAERDRADDDPAEDRPFAADLAAADADLEEEDTLMDEDDDEPIGDALRAPDESPAESPVESPVAGEPQAAKGAPATAPNPFDEQFDEEELVVDPFADAERVIPAAPKVSHGKRNELAEAFAAVAEADPAEVAPVAVAADAPSLQRREPVGDEESPIAARVGLDDPDDRADDDEDPIVLVEPDEPLAELESSACRQDYRQLFANLRQG